MAQLKPRIIIQTETYRVISIPRPPFEGNPRSDEIIVEERCKDGMGEAFWSPVHRLWDSRSGMTRDEKLMMNLFAEVAKQWAWKDEPVTVVERRPRPTEQATRDALIQLLLDVAKTVTNEALIPPDMPFDARDCHVGLRLTPGIMSDLVKVLPTWKSESAESVVKHLLTRAAEELRK